MKEDLDGNQRIPIWSSLKQMLKLKKLLKIVINLDCSQCTSICGGGDPAGMFYVPEHRRYARSLLEVSAAVALPPATPRTAAEGALLCCSTQVSSSLRRQYSFFT